MQLQNLIFFINGSHFSGAEKRLLLTAIKLSEESNKRAQIFISDVLYEDVAKSHKFAANDLEAVDFHLTKVPAWAKRVPRIYALAHVLKRSLALQMINQGQTLVHMALYNKADLMLAKRLRARGAVVVAEVTSPDIAVNANTRRMLASSSYCDAMICVSENVMRLCKEHWQQGGPKLLMRTLPFVEAESFSAECLGTKKNQVIFPHRLIDRKNPLLATQAFAQLAVEFPDWHFFICGKGPLADRVEALVKKSGQPNLQFAGYVPNVQNEITRSKIFVSIIEPDNYPSQSVLEAMARGCALVVSDTGQSVEKFLDEEQINGVVSTLTEHALIVALERLITHPDLQNICKQSISVFQHRYSQRHYVQESLALYRDIP